MIDKSLERCSSLKTATATSRGFKYKFENPSKFI